MTDSLDLKPSNSDISLTKKASLTTKPNSKDNLTEINDSKINLNKSLISPPNFFKPWNAEIENECSFIFEMEDDDEDDTNCSLKQGERKDKTPKEERKDPQFFQKLDTCQDIKKEDCGNQTMALESQENVGKKFVVTDLADLVGEFGNSPATHKKFLSKRRVSILVSPEKIAKKSTTKVIKKDSSKSANDVNARDIIQTEQKSLYREKNPDFETVPQNYQTSQMFKDVPDESSSGFLECSLPSHDRSKILEYYRNLKKEHFERKKKEKTDCFCF